jgi:hypothetical protein
MNQFISCNSRIIILSDGGLTKREYFAAKAMEGIIANKDGLDIKIERIVESAVDTADALD